MGAVSSVAVEPLRRVIPTQAAMWLVAAAVALSLLLSARRLLRAQPEEPALVPTSRLTARHSLRSDFVVPAGLGVATALLPCGTLYGALAVAATAPRTWVGAGVMVCFAAVSSVGLLVSSAAARALSRDLVGHGRRVVAAVLVAGAALVILRPLRAMDAGESCPAHPDSASTSTQSSISR